MIHEILTIMQTFLMEETNDATDFSIKLEDMLFDYYEEMHNENLVVTEFLNEDLPDICAGYELGNDIDEFKAAIKNIYDIAIQLQGNKRK